MYNYSVITSYRGRKQSLKRYLKSIEDVKDVKFYLVNLGDDDPEVPELCKNINYSYLDYKGLFDTGKAHNYAMHLIDTKWGLKQDIDCIMVDNKMYEIVNSYIWQLFYDDVIPFGAVYLESDGKVKRCVHCGNELLVSKRHWRYNKFFEWAGYGWEDYAYLLERHRDKLEGFEITFDNITKMIRDHILIPLNNMFGKVKFEHHWHEVERHTEYARAQYGNREKLWKLYNEI